MSRPGGGPAVPDRQARGHRGTPAGLLEKLMAAVRPEFRADDLVFDPRDPVFGGPACVVGTNNPFIKAATQALHEVFKKDTVFIRSGGSIPIVTDFQDVLKIPSVMMGFGLPDDNLHAPNEKFHIPNFYRGIESIIGFFEKLGE